MLDRRAIECLAGNIQYVEHDFDQASFISTAIASVEGLPLMQRAKRIAQVLKAHLPSKYSDALSILCSSFTPPMQQADEFGLAGFFYLPHGCFISEYGLDVTYNDGEDPFELSMSAMRELTQRFTAEFAIRPFLLADFERCMVYLTDWIHDPSPHVRRLCSEGTRPKLPWGIRLGPLIQNPEPILPILQHLKDDPELYVRRSVANHLGDIAKDHPEKVFALCESWLAAGSDKSLNWLIRHALRHPAKKGVDRALALRHLAR